MLGRTLGLNLISFTIASKLLICSYILCVSGQLECVSQLLIGLREIKLIVKYHYHFGWHVVHYGSTCQYVVYPGFEILSGLWENVHFT